MCHDIVSIILSLFGQRILLLSRRQFFCRAEAPTANSWVNGIMETSYDEDLSENPFLRVLRQDYASIFERAVDQGWIVCVPRCGSFTKSALVEDDFLAHILVPQEESFGTNFWTLSGKEVKVRNRVLSVEYDIAKPCCAHLLFEETFYTDNRSKYSLWWVSR